MTSIAHQQEKNLSMIPTVKKQLKIENTLHQKKVKNLQYSKADIQ